MVDRLDIHPTAIVPHEARLAPDVQIGPYSILEGPVNVGEGCVIGPHAHLIGPMTLGKNNRLHTGVVLGDRPQHTKYQGERTRVEIGDGNVFREHVTVHRGTTHSWVTRIGNNNFLMAHAHIAHDCVIGNNCILANGALVGGHCVLEDGVILSGNCAIHQFARVGRLALLSGVSATTKDIAPFTVQQNINTVVGVNVVGMRRSGMSHAQIDAVRKAYHIIYRQGLPLSEALTRLETQFPDVDPVQEMVRFLRGSTRGIASIRSREMPENDAA